MPCKMLRDEGLHTFLGMIGYCMKDNGEEHLSLCIIMFHPRI